MRETDVLQRTIGDRLDKRKTNSVAPTQPTINIDRDDLGKYGDTCRHDSPMLRHTRISRRIALLAHLPNALDEIDLKLQCVYTGGTDDSVVGDKPIPGLDKADFHHLLQQARREI